MRWASEFLLTEKIKPLWHSHGAIYFSAIRGHAFPVHRQMCMAVTLSDLSEQETVLTKEEKLSRSECNREQCKSWSERSAKLLQVLNAFAELMTGLTCYSSCSHWTLGNCYAVVYVDSLTFLSKFYLSLQKGTSPRALCHYSLTFFPTLLQKPAQLNTWICIQEKFLIKAQFYMKKTPKY